MNIIISPAKKMKADTDGLAPWTTPIFSHEAAVLLAAMRAMDAGELARMWKCSAKIMEESMGYLERMESGACGSPAVMTYSGIQFQYMSPDVFDNGMLEYVQEHVRILSGFYGVVRPMDSVMPYRLEMQAKLRAGGAKDLYAFWGSRIYDAVLPEDRTIIDLASAEYSVCVERYIRKGDRFVTCVFGEDADGKIVQKGVYAKMARGEMVRYLAEQRAEAPEQMKGFDRLGYRYESSLSCDTEYVFLRD